MFVLIRKIFIAQLYGDSVSVQFFTIVYNDCLKCFSNTSLPSLVISPYVSVKTNDKDCTAKNPERKSVLFSKMSGVFSKWAFFSSNRRIIRRFEKKTAHFEKNILIFQKRTDFFLTIFCSVYNEDSIDLARDLIIHATEICQCDDVITWEALEIAGLMLLF